ncbi:MAG: Crp/Fnr family transcriptional regulator [Betaproteobacteria bacterium]
MSSNMQIPEPNRPAIDLLVARVLARFPALAQLPRERLVDVVSHSDYREMTVGQRLFSPGEPCGGFPLLLKGSVRVVRETGQGKSIVLYTVHAGELCIVSSESLFAAPSLTASGYADSDVEVLSLSAETIDDLLGSEPAFRRFFYGLMSARLADLVLTLEAVAFLKLDQRLAALLVEKGPHIALTHQAIADHLGVAREMVSRVMRGFSEHGWIAQSREVIEVRDVAALDLLSRGIAK